MGGVFERLGAEAEGWVEPGNALWTEELWCEVPRVYGGVGAWEACGGGR